jgi:hypothetical protein
MSTGAGPDRDQNCDYGERNEQPRGKIRLNDSKKEVEVKAVHNPMIP